MRETNGSTDGTAIQTDRRRVLGGIGAVAVATVAGCSALADTERTTTTEEFTVDATSVDSVAVHGDDGETVVSSTGGDEVRVEATKYAIGGTDLSDVTVVREVTAGRLELGVELPEGLQIGVVGGGLEALEVRVPDGVRVEEVETDDGSLEVSDVTGDLDVGVDDGTADIDSIDGAVELNCDDGEVTVGAVDGVAGEFDDARLLMTEAVTVGDITADDGDLELAIGEVDGDVTVEADDGDIEAALSPGLDVTVDARTDDGSVNVEGGIFDTIETTDERTRGTVGTGENRLTIRVDDGTVRLTRESSDQ